jgi:hypothetical protein
MEACIFCNEPEKGYRPGKDIDFICGCCVILLADADQDDLKRAYQKALDKGYPKKVSALESFIIPEGNNEQIKPKSKLNRRHSHRKRSIKSVRSKKERIGRLQVQSKATILQGQSN